MFYSKELNTINKSNRYRKIELQNESLLDFASYDYLGFGENKHLLEKTFDIQKQLEKSGFSVGDIRPPMVKDLILRIIPMVNIDKKELEHLCKCLREFDHEL